MATKKPAPQIEGSIDTAIIERVDSYTEFYMNHAQFGFTGFDIFLFMSEAANGSDQRMRLRQKARVSMSPVEALFLARYLANTIAAYEEKYGKIIVPEVLE